MLTEPWTPTLTIGGEAASAPATFVVRNPANQAPVADAPDCSSDLLDAAMSVAQQAFPGWAATSPELRATALLRASDVLSEHSGELASLITLEQGKPLGQARDEVAGAAAWFRYYSKLRLEPEVIHERPDVRVVVSRVPMGVVAAITPWNFPLVSASWKIAPALAAGNTMVLKPSPYTPLSTLRVGELLRSVFPDGVLNVISGGDGLGARMTQHSIPAKVSFTGSTATGQRIAKSCAADLKRMTLELGGNDAAILLPDVEVAEIAEALFWGAFHNCGQVCAGVKRIYAHESMHGEVVDALATIAKSVQVGDGMDAGTEIGPINNAAQIERVASLVDDAIYSGARVAAGGHMLDGPGYFFAPTILTDVSDGVRIVDEEQFGPAVPVLSYRDVEDAVARANGTQFGLGASVWSPDVSRAEEVGAGLVAGSVWINTHSAIRADQPFSGTKSSGIGAENGPWGMEGFTQLKVLHRRNTV